MKQLKLLLIITSLQAWCVFSQGDTVEIDVFEGEIKRIILEDNPSVLPRWEINVKKVFCNQISRNYLGVHFEPRFHLNNRLIVSVPLQAAGDFSGSVLLNWMFNSKQKSKNKKIMLNYWSESDSLIYLNQRVFTKTRYLNSQYLYFGLGRSRFGYSSKNNNITTTVVSKIDDVHLGASFERSRAYKAVAIDKCFFNSTIIIHRFKVNFTYALSNSRSYLFLNNSLKITGNEIFSDFEFNPFGWKLSYEYQKGFRNYTISSYTLGLGVGQFIGFGLGNSEPVIFNHINQYKIDYITPYYFKLSIGLSLGGRTLYSKPK
ncbi:hypothetical protein [Putridiphycobacter roseus]|nr:hypothetical protein [Putridiphycobacter roseus]